MESARPGFAVVWKASVVLTAACLCSCAGKNAGIDARQASAQPRLEASESEDLRKYIDKFDPLTDTEDGTPRAVFDPPAGTYAGSYNDLESLIDTASIPDRPVRRVSESQTPADALLEAPPAEEDADDGVVFGPPAPAGAVEPEETPRERLARQVSELRETMRALRASGEGASAEAMELLALRLLDADSAGAELESLKGKLSLGQRRALTALESLLAELRAEDGATAALDARRLARLLTEHADKLADTRPIRITSAALCTSVHSYGSYMKFPDYTFLQGRAQPVIVYVALENFTQKRIGSSSAVESAVRTLLGAPVNSWERGRAAEESSAGDVVVELTETIAIHTDADDLVVWKSPEASVRDVSRDKRKDYYLVQRIVLPPRLTLGKYNVKVTVRDVATGATDEAIIPIEIVADPALASAR